MSKKAILPAPDRRSGPALKSAMKQDVFKATMELFELTKELLGRSLWILSKRSPGRMNA
ncbi:MAG: hypothetical protein IPO87_19440 [Flavobacteriales bacterium]|nr:hypothetical protein [Flavobacteriales bacterium]